MELVTDLNDALVTTLNMSIVIEQLRSNYFNKRIHPRSLKRIRHLQKDLRTIRTHAKLTENPQDSKSPNQSSKSYYCCRAERVHTLPKINRAHLLLKAVSTSNTKLKLSRTGHSNSPLRRNPLFYRKKSPPKEPPVLKDKSFDAKDIIERCVSSFRDAKHAQESRLKKKLEHLN